MVATKSALLFAAFSFCTSVVAVPPGCLLGALTYEEDPADLATICGDNSETVQQSISDSCESGQLQAALDAFSSTCEDAGYEVSMIESGSSSTGSPTRYPTASGSLFPTASGSGGAGPSPTSGGGSGGSGGGSGGGNGESTATGGPATPTGTGAAGINNADSLLVAGAAAVFGLAAAI